VIGREGFHDRGSEITEEAGRRTYHQRVRRFREGDCAACEQIAEVDGGMGCCMMYARSAALESGGYDPGFAPVWFDDVDLTMSMRRRGLKVFCFPAVRVVHHLGMRSAGNPVAVRGRAVGALRSAAGAMLPARLRRPVSTALGLDRPSGAQWQRLVHHYDYWRRKWGFDMLNPDMQAVRARWGGTEICWRSDPEMRAAGERMVAAFERR
jgi:hypothetical protein